MLELVEIAVGAVLFTVYAVLSVFAPVALFGVAAGFLALVVRALTGGVAGALARFGGSGLEGVRGVVRVVLVVVLPWAAGAAALLAATASLGGRATADPVALLTEGARLLIGVVAQIQDGAMRAWTGLPLEDALARTAEANGLGPLGVFTALVAARVHSWLAPEVSLVAFRWVFALVVAAVSLAAAGAWPLKALGALRLGAVPRLSRPRTAPPSLGGDAGDGGGLAPIAPEAVAVTPILARPAETRLALVTPRGEITRMALGRLSLAGFGDVTPFVSLQDLLGVGGRMFDVVLVDSRVLRWGTATGASPSAELARRTVLLIDAADRPPADAANFGAVLRVDALPDEFAAAVRAARRTAETDAARRTAETDAARRA